LRLIILTQIIVKNINLNELSNICSNAKIEQKFIKKMFDEVDRNNDGKIMFQDFNLLMEQLIPAIK